MIAIHQTQETLKVIISGECGFAVTRELLQACKIRLYESNITRIEILLKEATSLNSSVIGAMLLLSDWVNGNFQIHVENCHPQLSIPFTAPASN
ncbi:MAG: hypothetical protein ACXWFI_00285 [Methylobacter sp.]